MKGSALLTVLLVGFASAKHISEKHLPWDRVVKSYDDTPGIVTDESG